MTNFNKISDYIQLRFEKTYSLIKDEGFSTRFANTLIILTCISSISFGVLVLVALISNVFHFSPIKGSESLVVPFFIIFHIPVVILITTQKIITKKLIKKYRDEESNLIKP